MSSQPRRRPDPVGSGIVAPLLTLGEKFGEPLPMLRAQARNEVGEGVGVRRFLAFSATRSATSVDGRRKSLLAITCNASPIDSGAEGYRFNSCRAY